MTQPSRAEQLWRQAVKQRTGEEPVKHTWDDLSDFHKQRWFDAAEQEAKHEQEKTRQAT